MDRLGTAAVGIPLALVAIFLFPPVAFLAFCALLVGWAAVEFAALARLWTPGAPLAVMPPLAVGAGLGLSLLPFRSGSLSLAAGVFSLALVLSVGGGCLILISRTPVRESLPALGVVCFGIPYFALPIASFHRLRQIDDWVMVLLVLLVWLGDSAAFWVGTSLGRRKLAPVVSPNKTWEGAVAGLAAAVLTTAAFSFWRLGYLHLPLLGLGAVTGVAAQMGDLVESMFKRGAGVKDSGRLLPGHGGMFDRLDALLFAAPVLFVGLWIVGLDAELPGLLQRAAP